MRTTKAPRGTGGDPLEHPGYALDPALTAKAWMAAVVLLLPVTWHLALWACSDGLGLGDVAVTAWGLLTLDPLARNAGVSGAGAGGVVTVWLLLWAGAVGALVAIAWRLGSRAARRRRARWTRAGDGAVAAAPRGEGDGVEFATIEGRAVQARTEDSAVVVAPARSGKTTRVAARRVVYSAGPVLVTSTKADLMRLTAGARHAEGGRVLVFDPDGVARWPQRCHWDVVAGCEDVREATVRAAAMVAAKPLSGARNAGFFEGASEVVLRCLLHAAALEGLTMREVLRWARDFDDEQPFAILREHPGAAPGWDAELGKFTRGAAPETVSSVDMSLGLVLKPLSDPRVLSLVCPDGEALMLDVDAFVTSGADTLYVLAEGGGGTTTAPITTALVASVERAGRRASQRTSTGRLARPLTFVLDEAANVAPIPGLPGLMTDGGGRGMPCWTFFQAFAQMRHRWGREGADTIEGGGTIKLVLGGLSEVDDLERLSRLAGDTRVVRESDSSADGRSTTISRSTERERIFPPERIRSLPVGTGLLFYRHHLATLVDLAAWWERDDAELFRASERWCQQQEGKAA